MKAWQFLLVLALARAAVSCGYGCDDRSHNTTLLVLDADTLDPVCAFVDPPNPFQKTCRSVWGVLIESDSRDVKVQADGYQDRVAAISPVRFTTCGATGGCNVVFMVKE